MNDVGDAFAFTKIRNAECYIAVIPQFHDLGNDMVNLDGVEIVTKGVCKHERDFIIRSLMLAVEAINADSDPTVGEQPKPS